MEKTQIDDINAQIHKLRAALPIWGVDANDLVELARNAERVAAHVDERTMQRVRGFVETSTGWHNTLLYWEEQEVAPALGAEIRVVHGSLDAMRTESPQPPPCLHGVSVARGLGFTSGQTSLHPCP